jgi:hypothetical protein
MVPVFYVVLAAGPTLRIIGHVGGGKLRPLYAWDGSDRRQVE